MSLKIDFIEQKAVLASKVADEGGFPDLPRTAQQDWLSMRGINPLF